MNTAPGLVNPMLGSQLVSKSILSTSSASQNSPADAIVSWPKEQASICGMKNCRSQELEATVAKEEEDEEEASIEEANNNNLKETNEVTQQNNKQQVAKSSTGCGQDTMAVAQAQQDHQLLHESMAKNNNNTDSLTSNNHLYAKDLQFITKEAQELKIKTRKLQLEIEEKNEIINVLKDELETTKEQNDKFQRDNIQLLKDSKRVKFLQDENDFLQDKVGNVDKLELEIKRLKEKLNELDFLKLRIGELEEDRTRAQEESVQFEEKWKRAEAKLTRVSELEGELNKWKSFSHELESEKNSIQGKLLESIEQETKLNLINKQVEDEVKRLRTLIKTYEEQRDEERASNSLIVSVADLNLLDQSSSQQHNHSDIINESSNAPDTSIKFELDKQLEKELNEENRDLKQQLEEQSDKLNKLMNTNEKIRDELEGNKKLISVLRQDLACEKSLALKLTNQLTSFTKQIKNLDKQYFPIHDASLSIHDVNAAANLSDNNKLHESNGYENKNNTDLTNSSKSVEKESSLLKGVTSLELQRQQRKNALSSCEGDKKKNQGNNSDAKNTDNETRQQVNIETSSKSSTLRKEPTKMCSQPDNGIEPSKQSVTLAKNQRETEKPTEKGEIKTLLTVAIEQTEARVSALTATTAVTNKSAATLESLSDKYNDASCRKDRLLSTATYNNTSHKLCNLPTNAALQAIDRSESERKTWSSLLTDSVDELKAKRKHVHSNNNNTNTNNNGNNNRGNNVQHLTTSVSPSSNACSQSSSPSVAATIGHDSGFQSINHDFNQISPPNTEARTTTSKLAIASSVGLTTSEEVSTIKEQTTSTQPNRSTPITGRNVAASKSAAADRQSATPTQFRDKVPSAAHEANPVFGLPANGSQQKQKQQQISTANAASTESAPFTASTSTSTPASCVVDLPNRSKSSDTNLLANGSTNVNLEGNSEDDECDNVVAAAKPKRAPTPVGSHSTNSNFVRNSLPSRSVNFGHSKSSAYLDRIRASVTATTTTNTTSSFNEQTHRNIVLSSQQGSDSRYLLNCMLNHQHSERCFVANINGQQLQASQVVAGDHHHTHTTASPIRSSRQLNALIDPVSQERLVMSMLQHQGHGPGEQHLHPAHPQRPYIPLVDGAELTEQQIAHLTSLHHQHYYHHLQQMHQLHQMHHQHHLHHHHHRMHHKYPNNQSPQQRQQSSSDSGASQSATLGQPPRQGEEMIDNHQPTQQRKHCDLIYAGGSQFYAPPVQFDQVYANMAANNSINQLNEQQHHRTRLVNNNNHQHPEAGAVRSSPNRSQNIRVTPQKPQQHQLNHYTLPQIDEVNGLPIVETTTSIGQRSSPSKQRSAQVVMTSDAISKAKQHNSSSNESPSSSSSSSSSPTSSTSSNLSPSSASSSSSLNSLSASGNARLNRSALRHTTTELSRRQFSIERELIGAMPMTATLSQVSGRANGSSDATQVINDCHQATQSAAQMRTPVKSQQPPMRTSKILNISQQSGVQLPATVQQQQQQIFDPLNRRRVNSAEKDRVDKLASNLANIRLSNSLAFTSLRAPKNLSGGSGISHPLTSNSGSGSNSNGHNTSTQSAKVPTSSNSPDRRKQNNNATNDNGSGKSSVWFEYGCV